MLIIENGSQTPNANSFVTDIEYQAYALARNITIASTEAEREADLILAMDYLKKLEGSFQGCRVSAEQSLPYPRRGVMLHGFALSSDKIPQELKNAQMESAIYQTANKLLINGEQSNLASFSVDGVYSESYHKGGSKVSVRLDSVNAQLSPLLMNVNKLVRV